MNFSGRIQRLSLLALLSSLFTAPVVQAQEFDGIHFTLNGSAQFADGAIRLTETVNSQAGSAFMTGALQMEDATQFSLYFEYRIHGGTGDANGGGADGLTVTIHSDPDGPNALGGAGVGMGYSGISPSAAFEFDTWDNGAQDDSANAIGINVDGSVDSLVDATVPFDLESGDTLYAWMNYDGESDQLILWANDQPSKAGANIFVLGSDLASALGDTVYLGFTAGTGGLNANHDIERVVFVYGQLVELPEVKTVPVNGPWALLALLLGIALAGGWAVRRRVAA